MSTAYEIIDHTHDVVVVGAGGAGLRATLGMAASWFGQLVLFGLTFVLYFHLCNGVRHLYWDTGRGFERESVVTSVWVVLAVSVGLTVLTWLIAFIV